MADFSTMRRRWWTLLALGCLAACSGPTPTSGSGPISTEAATGTGTAGSTVAGPAAGGTAISLYFLRDGQIGVGQRQIAATDDAPTTAVQLELKGLTDVDKAAGLTTGLAATIQLHKVTVADGVATADVSRDLESRDSQPGVAQLVYALTQFPQIAKVTFLLDGVPNGAVGALPIGRADVPRLTPDLLIESPSPGLVSSSAVKVSGDIAARFPSFDYRVESAPGQNVAQGTLNAKLGSGPRKKFDQVVDLAPGTTGTVTMVVTPPAGATMKELRIPFRVA
jgi:hypothetical protein